MSVFTEQTSLPSSATSVLGAEDSSKIKLRLCYNGRFEQTPSHTWKFVGAEYFNESISYGVKYADFMFKLSEKFKTAVSVKYQAPGEELDPESLISVQDDADLQELVEDYFSHLERPGTPSKTFRIKVFVFMAAEEPLTPDEIMEGQTFFSESHALPPRVRTYRGLDGRSSWGSTLSSTGTPCTRQQDVSTGDWLSSLAGQPPTGLPADLAADLQYQQVVAAAAAAGGSFKHSGSGSGQHHLLGIDAAMEREALDRMRMSVSYHQSMRLAVQQQRLLHGSRGVAVFAEGEDEWEVGGEDDGDDDDENDDAQIAEVIAAIQEQQEAQQRAAAAAAAAAAAGADFTASMQPPSEEASLPADPWDMSDDAVQQPSADDRQLHTLPSHISAFGEDSSEHEQQEEDVADADAADYEEAGTEQQHQFVLAARGTAEGAGDAVLDAITAASQLPSHISAFGDDLASNLAGACAALAGSDELEQEAPANDGELAGRMAAGYGRPRTQDSSFSLDGDLGASGDHPGGQQHDKPDRQDSGDSLASLPKLQPVHRLAKPDLKIVAKIGEGAFGEVSVASAPLYGTVAVKWLKSERFGKHFASFGREAALLADLNHPNVLRFYGVVTESANDNTVIGIMTEYIRGGSMSSFLRMSRSLLPLRTRCELALAASNGLAYLHELRIVHFDLKPDNLLLDAPPAVVRAAAGADLDEPPQPPVGIRIGRAAAGSQRTRSSLTDEPLHSSSQSGVAAGGGKHSPAGSSRAVAGIGRSSSGPSPAALDYIEVPVVKVADFGLSKHKLNSTYVSSCRDLRGTLPYMAPELVADPERVSEKADVWSLGVVMWEMLTREVPFQDLPPQQILMGLMCGNLHLDVPEWCEPEWRGLLEACLEPNPSNRPSMRELARQLEAIRDQQLAQEQQQQQAAAQQAQQQMESQQKSSRAASVAVQPPSQQQQLLQPAAEQLAVQQRQVLAVEVQQQQQQQLSEQQQQRRSSYMQQMHDAPVPAPTPVVLLQRQQQQLQQLQQLAVMDTSLKQQQAAQQGLQQQLVEQGGRMQWLESAVAQQQVWMTQQAVQHQALHLQAHAAGMAAHNAVHHSAAAVVPPPIPVHAVVPAPAVLPHVHALLPDQLQVSAVDLPVQQQHHHQQQQQQQACALQQQHPELSRGLSGYLQST